MCLRHVKQYLFQLKMRLHIFAIFFEKCTKKKFKEATHFSQIIFIVKLIKVKLKILN